jgi:RimJ/RimL family protein N-acetyltransferase
LDSNIWLRRAEQSDCERYYEWANDPVVRKQSLSTDRIEWDSHSHWFSQQLTSPDSRLFVAIRNDQLVGQVRFNRSQGNEWTVSFSVAEEARGSGIGKQLLSLGAQHIRRELDATLLAIVRIENAASANCFRKLGWQPVQGVQKDLLRFRLSA